MGLIIGGFLAAFLGAGGMPLEQMTRVLQIVGFILGIAISYISFRGVVGRFLFPKLWDNDEPEERRPE